MEEHRQVAPSPLSPPGPCPPEGLSGAVGSLCLPRSPGLSLPVTPGSKPASSPQSPTSQKDQVLSLRGAGGGGEGL